MCAILGNVYECPELLPLTEKRPLATLPFDCKYRLIDFNLSNAINANIKSVYMVFNQGTTKSVFDHIGAAANGIWTVLIVATLFISIKIS